MAEEDGGVLCFLFCVLFQVQMRRICLQDFKIIGDVVRLVDGYFGGVFVLGVPREECNVPIALLNLD